MLILLSIIIEFIKLYKFCSVNAYILFSKHLDANNLKEQVNLTNITQEVH